MRERYAVLSWGSLLVAVATYASLFRLQALSPLGPLRNLAATLMGTLCCIWAARGSHAESRLGSSRSTWLLLFAGAVLLRVAMPWSLLEGSDDAYRYIWDGRVQAAGINPYLHPPAAAELRSLRDSTFHPRIFRPDMRTVYPPLAELWFLLAYLIGGMSVVGLKMIYLGHELAAVWLLTALLVRRGQPPMLAILYAWSPLAIVQGFAGAHLDILLVPWLLAAVLFCEDRPFLAGVALGLSAMIRPVTILGGPALALRRPVRETLALTSGFILVCTLLVVPFAVSVGLKMTESLRAYGQHWQFNGSLFLLPNALLNDWEFFRPALYVVIALLALGVGLLRGARWAKLAGALGCYFALAPTVYPWYFLGIHALLAMGGIRPLVLALPALVTLSDLVFVGGQVGGAWEVPFLPHLLEYLGLYGLLLLELVRRRTAGTAGATRQQKPGVEP